MLMCMYVVVLCHVCGSHWLSDASGVPVFDELCGCALLFMFDDSCLDSY